MSRSPHRACAVLFAGSVLALAAFFSPGCNKAAGPAKPRIAMIPKGTTHDHWKSVEAGARQACDELGYELLWKGPLREDELQDQIAVMQNFISEGVAGICLAPLDDGGTVQVVKAAGTRKIPVVIFDSAIKGEVGKDFVAFVGTDNKRGGRMAGDELARIMGGKGKVVMIRYKQGSASTIEREAGFMEAMAANPGLQVISSDQEAGATVDTAKEKSQSMLDTLRQADGIYTPNESSTLGTLLTLRQAGLLKGENRKKFVGFDASKPLVEAIESGELDAAVAQNPIKMGHDAVVAIVDHIHGKPVAPSQDTGAVLVSKGTLGNEDVKRLLKR